MICREATGAASRRMPVIHPKDGVPRDVAERAFILASAKLPIHTRFVTRLGEE